MMESTIQEAVPEISSPPTADIVGKAFVQQYYLILRKSPEHVFRFYQDVSKLGRPEEDGAMGITTTMQAINEKILSLDHGDISVEITTVDAQDSHSGGVLVLVTGLLTGKDDLKRRFTQTFFLAPQEKGYFVLNDVLRYVDGAKCVDGNQVPIKDAEGPLIPEHDASATNESHDAERVDTSAEEVEVDGGEVYNSTGNGDRSITIEEEEVPVAEVVDTIPDNSQILVESNSKIELPKKSYASIVKVSKAAPLAAPAHPPVKSVVKSSEQPTAAVAPLAPIISSAADTQVSSTNVQENGNKQDAEAEGPSIYVKGLPATASAELLENEFKKFGPIRSRGIQIRSQKGFYFGFLEFEEASAVRSAIEASPITIDGKKVVVEEKRSTRVNNKARSSAGPGSGYRNDGARGRGNYGGGRGYNRGGDYGNRNEFGNRNGNRGGGYGNRGGDGYQRDRGDGYQRGDQIGSNVGRVNRGGGSAVNGGAPKNVAPRVVSAIA